MARNIIGDAATTIGDQIVLIDNGFHRRFCEYEADLFFVIALNADKVE